MGTQKYTNEQNVKQPQRIEKDTKSVWHRKKFHVNNSQAQLLHFKNLSHMLRLSGYILIPRW